MGGYVAALQFQEPRMKTVAVALFLTLACGPGRMVSQAVAKPVHPIVLVDGGTVF